MTTRSRKETMVFTHPFCVKGIDRTLPEGTYEIISEEELIEGLSFPCYRRVGTYIVAPAAPPHQTSTEMILISALDLADALRNDASNRISAER
jgi:hypothetical protein